MHDAANYTLSHQGISDQPGYRGGIKASILSMLCGLLLWPTAGSAELYKWTDEQGNLHITDIPPPPSQKKPPPPVTRSPRLIPPNQTSSGPGMPELSHESVESKSVLASPSPKATGRPAQLPAEGLSLQRATLMSPWQTFEGSRVGTKAPVHKWKDERGLDRVSDVRPTGKSRTGAAEKHASLVRPENKE